MKFNSQICTSIKQSQHLLDLGLKPETADMLHYKSSSMKEWCILATPYDLGRGFEKFYQPAWSLHRLMEILDSPLIEFNFLSYDPYEEIISIISECIKKGYISKEYLNK